MTQYTPGQAFPVPSESDHPDIPLDLMTLATAIEKRVFGIYASVSDRSSKMSSPTEGQVAYLKDTNSFTFYDGSAWSAMFPVPPTFSSGTAAPSNASGANGDVYLKV